MIRDGYEKCRPKDLLMQSRYDRNREDSFHIVLFKHLFSLRQSPQILPLLFVHFILLLIPGFRVNMWVEKK